jgi:cyclophilin family peptidyl-prolyl cis-trans isomerase
MTRKRRCPLPAALYPLVLLVLSACFSTFHPAPLTDPSDARFSAIAPDSFDVSMLTTKGEMIVRARRNWSPLGVDRFYVLAKNQYFDSVAFFRTVGNFVAQFGLHGDTAVTRAWRGKSMLDEPVKVVNQKGTLSYARGGVNSRSNQLFFNTVDNTPRLDTLNTFGFPPIAQVIKGIGVLDSLNWEYGGRRAEGVRLPPGPSQDSLRLQGNAYLRRNYPRLDYILKARVVREWRG